MTEQDVHDLFQVQAYIAGELAARAAGVFDAAAVQGLRELQEEAVDVPGRTVDVLEEEDSAVQVDLPRRAHRLHQQPQASSGERSGDPPLPDRSGVRVVYDSSKPTTIQKQSVDVSRAKALLGFEPKVSFENGMRQTIDWYRATRAKDGARPA